MAVMTKFKRLEIGEQFVFADIVRNGEPSFSRWIKADTKWYQHAETGEGFKIDSVNTVVILIKEEDDDAQL